MWLNRLLLQKSGNFPVCTAFFRGFWTGVTGDGDDSHKMRTGALSDVDRDYIFARTRPAAGDP